MEYYCHRPGSQGEIVAAVNYLNKVGCSVEPVAIDGVVLGGGLALALWRDDTVREMGRQ